MTFTTKKRNAKFAFLSPGRPAPRFFAGWFLAQVLAICLGRPASQVDPAEPATNPCKQQQQQPQQASLHGGGLSRAFLGGAILVLTMIKFFYAISRPPAPESTTMIKYGQVF